MQHVVRWVLKGGPGSRTTSSLIPVAKGIVVILALDHVSCICSVTIEFRKVEVRQKRGLSSPLPSAAQLLCSGAGLPLILRVPPAQVMRPVLGGIRDP